MANYGDVALDLPANWNRNANEGKAGMFVQMIVGHVNGMSDAYKTEHPDERHQFNWINPNDEVDLNFKRSQGFEFIHKSTWTKNKTLWDWNAEGNCRFMGQLLAARPAELYFEDVKIREEATRRRDPKKEADTKLAEALDASRDAKAFDDHGVELKRKAR